MSFFQPIMSDLYLQLAVFRLNDMCIAVQEEMEGFLRTASLEKMPGVEATFTWLRKRGVRICLLSDYNLEDTKIILDRLGWTVDEDGTVQEVIVQQLSKRNPILLAQENASLSNPRSIVTIFDTPRLLQLAYDARVHLNLAICNGKCSYNELAVKPHHAILDKLVQLPNFLLEHLPQNGGAGPRVTPSGRLPRLRIPRTLFGIF